MDTSMGFSPSEGLMMSTRSGDLDPGIPLYLQREAGLDTEALDRLINRESGLAGVSGISANMRTLLKSREPSAGQAVEMYCYRIRKYIGAYMAVLGGVDAIVFGGGIGENAWQVRERVLEPFEWAGIVLDGDANRHHVGKPGRLSAPASRTEVWTFPSDEAEQLAREGLQLMEAG
jgi:acetate kinase